MPPLLPRRTARLVLRPFRAGDEPDALAYRGLPDVCRYMPADPLDPADAGKFVAERARATSIAADGDAIILAVEREGRVIGDVVIKAGRLDDRQAEVGWSLNPDYQGRGYATEAARELIDMAFTDLGMHRAWAQLDPRNAASARVCERLGMRQEAYFREDIWFKGEWGSTAVYAILASEWLDRGQPPASPATSGGLDHPLPGNSDAEMTPSRRKSRRPS
jgi:RimJ/RimL family protein N-acetyltransferase